MRLEACSLLFVHTSRRFVEIMSALIWLLGWRRCRKGIKWSGKDNDRDVKMLINDFY